MRGTSSTPTDGYEEATQTVRLDKPKSNVRSPQRLVAPTIGQSSRSGCPRTMRSERGAKLYHSARSEPTWLQVFPAICGSMRTGSPAADASNWAWHERSMVMNHHTASSTDCPAVNSP